MTSRRAAGCDEMEVVAEAMEALWGFERKKNSQLVIFLPSKCVLDSCVFSVAWRVETGGWLTYSSGGRLGSSHLDGFRERAAGPRGGAWLAGRTGGSPWPIEAVASLLRPA